MKEIPLGNGQVVMVDDQDHVRVAAYPWRPHTRGYAQTSASRFGRRGVVLMHRLIMRAQPGQILDHIDGNRLNNCRANLRFCTASQNRQNCRSYGKSTYKGAYRNSRGYKWRTVFNGKEIGYFDTEIEAARAYDAAAIAHHGAFAHLNFPRPAMAGAA